MFLKRTDVTCLTLPLYFTPVHNKTNPQSFAYKLAYLSIGRSSIFILFACLFLSSCTEVSQPDSYNQVYDVFGNMEHEDEFWQEIDTSHVLIANKRYAQAKARLLKVRKSLNNEGHKAIIKTISRKIDVLQRKEGDAFSVLNTETSISNPYLQSESPADLMLAYNLAASYVKGMAKKLEAINFPKTLEKSKHVEFRKGVYRIRSYATIHTASGKKLQSRFNCDIKVHKDRKNFTIKSLEISK